MSIDSLERVAVVGAGQMGSGIALVLACAGYRVALADVSEDSLKRGIGYIEKQLSKMVEKEKISAVDAEAARGRLSAGTALDACAESQLVIEAIIENLDIKTDLFQKLNETCPRETILASNTSSISITKLAAVSGRPDNVVGMHFMNPVPVMKLVELIRGLQTSDAAYDLVYALTEKLGKTPVTALRDYPGFIVNRILLPMLNEAFYALMENVATAEDIDTAMKLGTNQPMGPLALADFVGLDTCLYIMQYFHQEMGEDKYRPCPLLIKYVEAGWLGKKAGRGVYQY